ncbi:MAG: hypothetical protein HQK54_12785, partial [Oligoflexales bacterium]|nr:hypothetical protein [Oligoflexales bacterium]
DLSESEKAFETAKARETSWKLDYGWAFSKEDFKNISSPTASQLEYVRSIVEKLENKEKELLATRRQLTNLGKVMENVQTSRLSAAISVLEEWLRCSDELASELEREKWVKTLLSSEGSKFGASFWAAMALLLTIILIAALYLPLPLSLVLSLLSLIAAGLITLETNRSRKTDPGISKTDHSTLYKKLQELEQRFIKLDFIEADFTWTPFEVRNEIEFLKSKLAESLVSEERNRQRQMLSQTEESLCREWQNLIEQCGDMANSLKMDRNSPSVKGCYLLYFAEQLSKWGELRLSAIEAQTTRDIARARYEDTKSRIYGLLEKTCFEKPTEDLPVALDSLTENLETYFQLKSEEQSRQAMLRQTEARFFSRKATFEKFYSDRNISPEEFRDISSSFLAWKKAREEIRRADLRVEEIWNNLKAKDSGRIISEIDSGFDYSDILEMGKDRNRRFQDIDRLDSALNEMLECAKREIESLKNMHDELGQMKERLNNLIASGTIETALLERDQKAENLENHRRKELEARTIDLVIDHIREFVKEENLPEQLRIASGYFEEFTGYRYTLEIKDGKFIARDELKGKSLELHELSSGTRVQLFISVRLAFVEFQEGIGGTRLPLFLDEVLANSDDERSLAIIRALVTLSQKGRQIFYFTAQVDEVEKWEKFGNGMVKTIDMAHERGLELVRRTALVDVTGRISEVPHHNGDGIIEYGKRLSVPVFDIWSPLEKQHGWHLFVEGDQETLFRFLSADLKSIGQIARFLSADRRGTFPDGNIRKRIEATAEIIRNAQIPLRKILPRPLVKGDIMEADLGIRHDSPHFPRLMEIFEKSDNARSFADAILSGAVPRLKSEKSRAIIEWLQCEGYLPQNGAEDGKSEILAEIKGRYSHKMPIDDIGWTAVERIFH